MPPPERPPSPPPGQGAEEAQNPGSLRDPDSLHQQEARFHDRWARQAVVGEAEVRAFFESPVALENRFLLSLMGDLRGQRILDVGAGLGESSVYFALRGAHVTLYDLSPEMVGAAQDLARAHGVSLEGRVGPAEELEVPAGSFDIVYCANLLHHLGDKAAFFRRARRALRPAGLFCSWDPLAYNPVINVYRRMATEVRTPEERPLTWDDLEVFRESFDEVGHREFWIASLGLFLKYYLLDRIHPNQDRYWKRIYRQSRASLWWWYPLWGADLLLTRLPLLRNLAWNTAFWGRRIRP